MCVQSEYSVGDRIYFAGTTDNIIESGIVFLVVPLDGNVRTLAIGYCVGGDIIPQFVHAKNVLQPDQEGEKWIR